MSTEAMDRIRAELIKKIRQTGVVPDDFVVPLVDGYETVIAQVSALTAENERLWKERDEARRLIERVLKRHATINTLCDADRYELGRALAALPPTPPATEGSDV